MRPKTIAWGALGILGFAISTKVPPPTIAQNVQAISDKKIALSAGHWIYARSETGAAGEKEMNKLIVEALQPMLEETGSESYPP
ncbi:hypothetical protein NG798_25035 [Ancylothrix sp. C2]|uniref:hypothetical protein n=1 Tax=Ancylothrix sp. D3o TaxID=2953691 RepID=UPI0021BA8698|nr:hypothetical protein [Ancylothrix sp. D3o]MCT7953067.1 hypothetical protein [Ancylothrix sp. D3o]